MATPHVEIKACLRFGLLWRHPGFTSAIGCPRRPQAPVSLSDFATCASLAGHATSGWSSTGVPLIFHVFDSGHTDTIKSLFNAEVPANERTADGRGLMELAPDLATKEVLAKFSRATKSEL